MADSDSEDELMQAKQPQPAKWAPVPEKPASGTLPRNNPVPGPARQRYDSGKGTPPRNTSR